MGKHLQANIKPKDTDSTGQCHDKQPYQAPVHNNNFSLIQFGNDVAVLFQKSEIILGNKTKKLWDDGTEDPMSTLISILHLA